MLGKAAKAGMFTTPNRISASQATRLHKLCAVVWAGHEFYVIRVVGVVSNYDPKLVATRSNADDNVAFKAPEFRYELIVDDPVCRHYAGSINIPITGVKPSTEHSSEWQDTWVTYIPGRNDENLGPERTNKVRSHSVKVSMVVCYSDLNRTRGPSDWRFYIPPQIA
jgi:hypothetical protein